ncbi:MAG TPA: ATPase, T2SS/T4P/T4SS family [Steroidobacteraceae bacterium]
MIRQAFHEQMLATLLEPIAELLHDASVSEIMLNGHARIYCERCGRIEATKLSFPSAEALLAALRNVAQFVGRPFDAAHPLLEGRLPDGSRLQAVVPPAAPDGPMVSIRRFSRTPLTVADLVSRGALDADTAAEIAAAIRGKQNLLISGGTGTGKTSLLNALSALIPDTERVVVMEDSHELELQRQHVVHLEAQPGDAEGRGQVSIRDLFRATLRMRPDRIVVGEIRGAEALELIAATTSGHGGCMSTLHAASPRDALARLETMAMMSDVRMPLTALRSRIASGIDMVIQVERCADGRRRVSEVAHVLGPDPSDGYMLRERRTREEHES